MDVSIPLNLVERIDKISSSCRCAINCGIVQITITDRLTVSTKSLAKILKTSTQSTPLLRIASECLEPIVRIVRKSIHDIGQCLNCAYGILDSTNLDSTFITSISDGTIICLESLPKTFKTRAYVTPVLVSSPPSSSTASLWNSLEYLRQCLQCWNRILNCVNTETLTRNAGRIINEASTKMLKTATKCRPIYITGEETSNASSLRDSG